MMLTRRQLREEKDEEVTREREESLRKLDEKEAQIEKVMPHPLPAITHAPYLFFSPPPSPPLSKCERRIGENSGRVSEPKRRPYVPGDDVQ